LESLKPINKIFGNTDRNENSDIHHDISSIIIPFSKVFKIKKKLDIYSGNEKIPFKERDPEYKLIFRQEFTNILNSEFKIYKPVVTFPSF